MGREMAVQFVLSRECPLVVGVTRLFHQLRILIPVHRLEHTPALSSPTFRKISNHRQLDPLPTVRLKHQDNPRDEAEKPKNEQQRVDPSHLEPNGVIEDGQSCPKKHKQNGLKRVEAEKAVALVWLR